jgi:hypothetical protein
MANKQTIQDVDARLDVLHRRLSRTVNEITELRAKRKKIVAGKIKVPPPPGVKVKIESNGVCANEFGDLIPSFGSGAAIE